MTELATSGHTYSPADVAGGRRHRRSAKKLRLVKKKTVRRMLAKQGLKMRGGGPEPSPAPEAAKSGPAPTGTMGGRRRKSHGKNQGKSHRRGKSLFGMRF